MMHNHDDELERILAQRDVPQMRSNLEHRIVEASLSCQGRESVGRDRSFAQAFFDLWILPRSAAAMLVVVLGVGVLMGGEYTGAQDVDVSAYFLTESELLDMEDWYE